MGMVSHSSSRFEVILLSEGSVLLAGRALAGYMCDARQLDANFGNDSSRKSGLGLAIQKSPSFMQEIPHSRLPLHQAMQNLLQHHRYKYSHGSLSFSAGISKVY